MDSLCEDMANVFGVPQTAGVYTEISAFMTSGASNNVPVSVVCK